MDSRYHYCYQGPLTYLVRVPGNNRRFVHADHIIADDSVTSMHDVPFPDYVAVSDIELPETGNPVLQRPTLVTLNEDNQKSTDIDIDAPQRQVGVPNIITIPGTHVQVTRSGRAVKAAERLNL